LESNGFQLIFQLVKQNTQIERLGAISGHLDPTWCHLGAILAQSWPRLEPILAQLLLAHLKLVFVHLGRILAHLGTEIPNNLKKAAENQRFGIYVGRFSNIRDHFWKLFGVPEASQERVRNRADF